MQAPFRLAQRAQRVTPLYVMELAKAAQAMAAQGGEAQRRMLYLNIGEPDFTAPPLVQAAAERAIRDGRTQYTQASGLLALREAISGWYAQRFGLNVDPSRIIVTAGAPSVPQPCRDQLAIGGRLVIPVGDRLSQILVRVTRVNAREFREERLFGCRFVPLVGRHGWESA